MPESHWNLILRRIEEKKITPFIGPQVYEYWLPAPANIAKEWAGRYHYQGERPDVLAKVVLYLGRLKYPMFPKVLLKDELQEIPAPNFDLPENKDTPYAILAQLPFPIYITTNYDNFMEKALKDKGRNPVTEFCRIYSDPFVSESVEKKSEYSPEVATPLVYHLHGILDIPESIVLTEKDYHSFVLKLNTEAIGSLPEYMKEPLSIWIKLALQQTSLLFIGYDIEDALFRVIFEGISSFLSRDLLGTNFAVQAVPSLGKSQSKLREQFTTAEDRIKKACETSASYAKDIFEGSICWGKNQQFFEELRDRWNKSRIGSIAQVA